MYVRTYVCMYACMYVCEHVCTAHFLNENVIQIRVYNVNQITCENSSGSIFDASCLYQKQEPIKKEHGFSLEPFIIQHPDLLIHGLSLSGDVGLASTKGEARKGQYKMAVGNVHKD